MKKIPKFKTDEEAARFWETHHFQDYYRDTKEAGIRFIKRPKRTVAVRFDPDDIKSVEKIAERKGLSYTSLLRMWIKEHLNKEERQARCLSPMSAGEFNEKMVFKTYPVEETS